MAAAQEAVIQVGAALAVAAPGTKMMMKWADAAVALAGIKKNS